MSDDLDDSELRAPYLTDRPLVVMLISVVALVAVGFVGEQTSGSYEAIGSGFSTDAELDDDLSPEEKWEKARVDYDDAIADAKAKRSDDKAKANADHQAAVAANNDLPKAELKAANADAKAERKSANTVADKEYDASVNTAKAAKNAAKAEYNANK